MMTYGILLALALFMRFGPDIAFRGMLNRHLVERPLEILLARKRHQYLFILIASVMLLISGEALLLFGPELMLAYAADLALYVDVVVIAAASASWSRTHAVLSRWRPRFERQQADKRKAGGATPRSKRTQRTPAALSKANDDDGPGAEFLAPTWRYPMAA